MLLEELKLVLELQLEEVELQLEKLRRNLANLLVVKLWGGSKQCVSQPLGSSTFTVAKGDTLGVAIGSAILTIICIEPLFQVKKN